MNQRLKVDISAGTAFKFGFFAYFGMMCGALIVGIIVALIMALLGAGLWASFASTM